MLPEESKIILTANNSRATVVCEGQMDLRCAEELRSRIVEGCDSCSEVSVDMREVGFIDSAILSSLISGAKRLREHGRLLRVVVSSGSHPAKVLEVTGLDRIMDVVVGSDGGSD